MSRMLRFTREHMPLTATPEVVEVNKKVRKRREDIVAAVELGISNGRVESINNKIKVAVRMGYGFINTDNMIALPMLRCSDVRHGLSGKAAREGQGRHPAKAAA